VARVKKNDTVVVLAGKDRDKKGKVLRILLKKEKAIVEGVNLVKKHMRPTRDNPKGGIVSFENPINISNIMLVCPRCGQNARISFKKLTDGTKKRVCKKCQEIL
jgi:large subunit ribosomal protein L24